MTTVDNGAHLAALVGERTVAHRSDQRGGPETSVYPPEPLVTYDADWVARYARLAADLRAALGSAWVVEHIGSTSVPGLVAKPVIDLAVRLPPRACLDDYLVALTALGWSGPHDLGTHRCLFLLERNVRHAVAHFFTADQWQSAHQRLFAAWLRGHDDDRDAYARLKRALVDSGVWGQEYTSAKTEFVQAIVDRARAARGLDPAPVWDAAATNLLRSHCGDEVGSETKTPSELA